MKEYVETNEAIQLPNVDSNAFKVVLTFFEQFQFPLNEEEHKTRTKTTSEQDLAFFNALPLELLFRVYEATSYLDCKFMMDVISRYIVTTKITGKSAQEIRTAFGINKPITEDEIKELQKHFSWIK